MITSIFKWLFSVIEDRNHKISHKRVGFFWCLWMLSRAVTQPNVNEIVLYTIAGLAFGLAGLTLPEGLPKLKSKEDLKG